MGGKANHHKRGLRMNREDLEGLYRELQSQWRDMEDWVKRTSPTATQSQNFVTERLPESYAEELLRLSQLHQQSLRRYIEALKIIREKPLPQPLSTPDHKLTLSVDETAKLLGVSRNTVYEAIRQNRITAIRFGRRMLVPRAALEQLLLGNAED